MIYKTHIRNNLSTRWPSEFIAGEFQQIKGQKLMELPAAVVDGAVEPQAAIFAYQVDSSSDSTRRLNAHPGRWDDRNVGSSPKKQICKGERLWSEFTVSQQVVSVQKLVPSFYWTSQPDGICRRKCKCLTKEKREREHGRPFVVTWSITGTDRQRGAGRWRLLPLGMFACLITRLLVMKNCSATLQNTLIWRDVRSPNCYPNHKQLEKFQMFFSCYQLN